MSTLKLTLQNRITTLMVISSAFFISVFTFIQLNNQIKNIQRYNSYQANLSSIIVKNNLEATIRQIQATEIPAYLESGLEELAVAKIINTATIFDPYGKIIASTEKQLIGEEASYKDINKAQDLEIAANEDKNKWFIPEIDTLNKQLYIYAALKIDPQGKISYIVKLSFALGNIQEALLAVYKPAILVTIIVILANIILGFLFSKVIIGPIKILNEVTKIIAQGELSVRTSIHTNDELEELGQTFNYMTEQLIKMKERAENANPLTKLPGNIVIHEEVEKRIQKDIKFMVIYCDLDNFKAFNDKYGIAKGDEAIGMTAEIFKEAIKTKGDPEDFIGHEGGDDFILLTAPERAQDVADYIIQEFDKRARNLYSQEDLTQGYITAIARDGSVKQFPIMTISLSGVTNAHRVISSYGQVANIAAEVKKKAKSTPTSVFVVDKRQT